MPWSDHRTALHDALLAEFGEQLTPCTAAGSPTGGAVTGVLYRRGDALVDQWPGQSIGFQYSDQPQPFVTLLADDATGIAQNSHMLSDDGTIYRATRIHPADDGLVRVDLIEDNH